MPTWWVRNRFTDKGLICLRSGSWYTGARIWTLASDLNCYAHGLKFKGLLDPIQSKSLSSKRRQVRPQEVQWLAGKILEPEISRATSINYMYSWLWKEPEGTSEGLALDMTPLSTQSIYYLPPYTRPRARCAEETDIGGSRCPQGLHIGRRPGHTTDSCMTNRTWQVPPRREGGTSVPGKDLAVPPNIKHRATPAAQQFHSQVYTQENWECVFLPKPVHEYSKKHQSSEKVEPAQYSSADGQINQVWSIHAMECCLSIKKNKGLIHGTTWMDLENMLSQRCWTQKANILEESLMCKVWKRQIHWDGKMSGCQGLGEWEIASQSQWVWVGFFFWRWKKIFWK